MSLQPGTRLGPYEILAPLGAGGMGEVWKAKDTRLDRFVAVKVLPDHLAKHPESLARFEREAKAVAALNHPNITGIHDFATQGDTTYVVMELLEGESLRTRLESGPLPPRKATELAIQMAQGLTAAHEKGVVHRDLKPDNLWITKEGRLKILDFGLAKQITAMGTTSDSLQPTAAISPGHHTEKGIILGTLGYMSPEQVRGESVDARSDIFSFGVVFFEMLTGKRAFVRDTAADTMAAILKEDPPAFEGGKGPIPPGLHDLLDHCLEKEPCGRFQSARDLVYALQHTDKPAVRGATKYGFPRPLRIAAMLLSAAALIGLGLALGYRHPSPLPTFAPLTEERGTLTAARFVPNESEVIFSARWEGQTERWFTRKLDRPGTTVVPGSEGPLVSVSGDGEALGLAQPFLNHGQTMGRLYSLSTNGGSPREWAEQAWGCAVGQGSQDAACILGMYGGEIRIEWPFGHPIYQNRTPPKSPRIHGDRLVLFQETKGIVEDGILVQLDRQGNRRELTTIHGFTGLAWGPQGKEIWISTYKHGQSQFLALDLSGHPRVLLQHAGRLELQDVDDKGNVLAALHTYQRQTYARREGEAVDRNIGWLEAQTTWAISGDGRQLLLAQSRDWNNVEGPLYLRPTSGEPARRLGLEVHQYPTLSRDGKWVAGITTGPMRSLVVAPVGPAPARTYPLPGFDEGDLTLQIATGGRTAYLWGEPKNGLNTEFALDLEKGSLQAITPKARFPWLFQSRLSPDGRWLTIMDSTRTVNDGGSPILVYHPDGTELKAYDWLNRGEAVSAWGADSASLYVWNRNRIPAALERLDLKTGHRQVVAQVAPSDPAGIQGIQGLLVSDDGKTLAYNVKRMLSQLYLIKGLK